MKRFPALLAASLVFATTASSGAAADPIRHELTVRVDPAGGSLKASDTVTLPVDYPLASGGTLAFALHGGLSPSSVTPGVTVRMSDSREGTPPLEFFEISLPPGGRSFTLEYGGVIAHPLSQVGEEYARGQMTTPGTISSDGVYLSSASFWYPVLESPLLTFSLHVEVPDGWTAVSQGRRSYQKQTKEGGASVRWEIDRPQDDIYLVAAPFIEFRDREGSFEAMVFLREDDGELARRYLDATLEYVRMYAELLGPYPYGKFALVENFWETGYGMPSFTLLGPRVLRFPFILHSSYPHEILHNWWGNGVFVDYESGNWGEGLTAYLSDHLIKEQRGEGAEHRLTALQKYADYVLEDRDLPLSEFRSRHGSVSEAVGYGKALMLFHMLRVRLGDSLFARGLQDFYGAYLFRSASFDDLRRSFEKTSGESLEAFFRQWVERPGAPELRLGGIEVSREGEGYRLRGTLSQVQREGTFEIDVPLAITVDGQADAEVRTVALKGPEAPFDFLLPAPPLRVDADPSFDIFRRLHPLEIPPALTRAFGAERPLILLPSSADDAAREMYRSLTGSLSRTGPGRTEVALDSDFESLPPDRSVWILGWENRFFGEISPLVEAYGASFDGETVRLGRTDIAREGNSFVLTASHPRDPDLALLFIATGSAAAVPGLGRKLPHYHKYSYLAFEGDEPDNISKGRWPATGSPLTVFLPDATGASGSSPPSPLPERKALAERTPLFSKKEMAEAVSFLAGDDLEGRGIGTAALDRAAEYVAERFRSFGLQGGGDGEGGFFQAWEESVEGFSGEVPLRNVVALLPGSKKGYAGQIVVVGAHYDGLGRGDGRGGTDTRKEHAGRIHPGADDNAGGVAVLLELARVLGGGSAPERTVAFVAFTGEEAGRLGSRRYVEALGKAGSEVRGMLNLDTVGRLGSRKLLVLGSRSAQDWGHILRGAGYLAGVDVEMVHERIDASDHVSFDEKLIPAIQLFTGPHLDYHRPGDRPEKVDFDGLVKVAGLSLETVRYLAGREEPLTSEGPAKGAAGGPAGQGGRKVSLGTVPDFAFDGPGVRIEGVVPGSPAEEAGLVPGDIIVTIGRAAISSLKDLSDALKERSAGEKVSLTFLRGGEERTAQATLVER